MQRRYKIPIAVLLVTLLGVVAVIGVNAAQVQKRNIGDLIAMGDVIVYGTVVSVGDGSIIGGIHKGFTELHKLGWIERILGAFLVLTGILFITGGINDIGNWLLITFPDLFSTIG